MMAPARNTGSEARLAYRDLARKKVRISRSVDLIDLGRVRALLDEPAGADEATANRCVAVELQFRLDDEGLVWVQGEASTALTLFCNRCAEDVDFPLSARFELCIVADEASADALADSRDLLVAEGPTVSIADVIEDELLLALPERLCAEDPCERMPELAYPADHVEIERMQDDARSDDEENPFAALKGLKAELSKDNDER